MNVLHLDSGLFEQSVSRQLSAQIVDRLRRVHPGLQVIHRDLTKAELPHLSAELLTAGAAAADQRSAAQQTELALAEQLQQEFFNADILVIGAPMYNFGIPTQLKAWFDRILKAGVTFRYTEQGPQGMAGGRQVIIASARGGVYGDDAPADFQESYLRALFGFIGIDDVTVIRAEGVNMGEAAKAQALAGARVAIDGVGELAGVA
jgi:FMN-dependent NADH-azoreductase